MTRYPTQGPAGVTAVGLARVRTAFACAMATNGSWSSVPSLGITADHKPAQPRRLRVASP
jgi:hypothetical protein